MSARPLRTQSARQLWLLPALGLGLVAALAFVALYLVDWWGYVPAPGGDKPGPLELYFRFDPEAVSNALGNLAQVIAAVLGIVITVVSIVVQLAATRYTPRITDMFFRDRTNVAVLSFFVVAGLDAVWVSLSVNRGFIPRLTITAALALVTASVLLMIPYFGYVFEFLDPEKIVARIEQQALDAALPRHRIGKSPPTGVGQVRVTRAIEQLADVAMNAISQKDKLIAQGAIDALRALAVSYLDGKKAAPAPWFALGPELRRNPDFVSMAPESLGDLEARRVWVEWKILRQMQALYAAALGEAPDINYLVAIDTRYVGDAAIEAGDAEALGLVVKFFNTYLRATLNAREVRTAYNLMNQYRQLCELAIERNARNADGSSAASEIGGYFHYYGLLAQQMELGFIAETIAYDLAAACERAFRARSACHEELLELLLTLDQDAGTGAQREQVLHGIRKAQVKLATFYLLEGASAPARRIAEDIRVEPASRLSRIREELSAATSRDFWEVVDRGTNFDFLDDKRKERLGDFFALVESHAATVGAFARVM